MASIAVVGLGAMGSRLALRLVAAGHDVVVWNRSHARTGPLADAGAHVADSPAAAAAGSELVITMVRDPAALLAVTEGAAGVAAGADAGTVVAQMSTVAPRDVLRLAKAVGTGVEILDAPVLGSVDEADAGTLTIFAGGADSLVAHWRGVLSALGRVVHVGEVGAGSAAKLVANSTLFGVLGLLGEALALADRLGLPREVAFDVLSRTPLAAQADRRRPSVESGAFPPRFALALARKDADLIADAAGSADLRLGDAARSWLRDAEAAGLGDEDYSAVLARILR